MIWRMVRNKLAGETLKDVRSAGETESEDTSEEFVVNETKKTLWPIEAVDTLI